MSKEEINGLALHKFFNENTEPETVANTVADPSDPFLNPALIKSQYQPIAQVQAIIDSTIEYLSTLQADNFLSSFDNDWYKNNNFSPQLVEYLARMNINWRIWRLRFHSCLYGEGFLVPFLSPDDTAKLQWLDLTNQHKLWATRLVDDYKGISFFFRPIKEFYQQTFVISFFPDTMLYINLDYQGEKPKIGSSIPIVDNDFSFYEAIITRKKQDTGGDIWIINWPNDPNYNTDANYCRNTIRNYAEAQFQGLNDLQLSGNRLYRFYSDLGVLDINDQRARDWKQRNDRIINLSDEQQLTNPAQIGDTTFVSTASNIDNNLIYERSTWRTIGERLSLYNDGLGKGGANQHSLEILLQNRKGIALNSRKVSECKTKLIKLINMIIVLLKFPDKPLTEETFTFEYRLQIFELANALATTNADSD